MTYSSDFLSQIASSLEPLRNRRNAIGAQKYMKDIAPFLGVRTPERRSAVKKIAQSLKVPTSDELARTARGLWKLPEREYQYAAYDLLQIHIAQADKDFLADHIEYLITHKSWWDTVDGLGTAAVAPLTDKFGCEELMNQWSNSDNIWLVRSAIQHQRGRKYETDVKLILSYCHKHADAEEFFIVKAIGWALRDIAKIDPKAVRTFLAAHPALGRVAVREAERGLRRL